MVLGYAELVRALVAGQPGHAAEPHPLQPRGVPEQRRRPGPAPRLRHLAEAARTRRWSSRFTPTPCDYWIFQLCNIWQENLDCYEEGQGYVTQVHARGTRPTARCASSIAERGPGARRQLDRSVRPRARRHGPAADQDAGRAAAGDAASPSPREARARGLGCAHARQRDRQRRDHRLRTPMPPGERSLR